MREPMKSQNPLYLSTQEAQEVSLLSHQFDIFLYSSREPGSCLKSRQAPLYPGSNRSSTQITVLIWWQGSGVMLAAFAGRALQKVVGVDQDIIGFDPRGIHTTTPRADCYSFPDLLNSSSPAYDDEDYVRGNYHRFLWRFSGSEIGIVNSSSVALQKLDKRARGVAELCQMKDELYGDDSILKYVNTPNVARDMLSIIDAWDEWTSTLNDEPANLAVPVEAKEENLHSPTNKVDSSPIDTKGKLVFLGFSYGVSSHSQT